MDYHIEISSIVQFVNDQLRQNTIVKYNTREIYTHFKKAVLDSIFPTMFLSKTIIIFFVINKSLPKV
jgi:hypothetical protein